MSDLESRCLDAFPQWLKGLGDDARALAALLDAEGTPDATRRKVAGAVNYLFKSLDLIPDGIEDLGFIDDAFVFRAVSALAVEGDSADGEVLKRLAEEWKLIEEFLGADAARLSKYAGELTNRAARGRSVDEIVGDDEVRAALVSDVKAWAESYEAPPFTREPKNLVKLRSFLDAKLPS